MIFTSYAAVVIMEKYFRSKQFNSSLLDMGTLLRAPLSRSCITGSVLSFFLIQEQLFFSASADIFTLTIFCTSTSAWAQDLFQIYSLSVLTPTTRIAFFPPILISSTSEYGNCMLFSQFSIPFFVSVCFFRQILFCVFPNFFLNDLIHIQAAGIRH